MKIIKCKTCKGKAVKFDKFGTPIPCNTCGGVGFFRKEFDPKDKDLVIAIDFDAVISTYQRPFEYDKLGKPVKEVIEAIRHFHDKGCYILIFTGRQSTPKIMKWLKKYKVPYDGFNVNLKPYIYSSRFKPYYDVIIDDKAVNFDWKNNRKSKKQLIEEIDNILELGQEGKE